MFFSNRLDDGIAEIKFFGLSLSFILILSVFFWKQSVPFFLSQKMAICWPFFDSCATLRPIPDFISWISLGAITLFALLSIICCLRGQFRAHLLFLSLGFFLKAILFIQDYRLMGNYHWMPFWCFLVYCFTKNKESLLKILIILFYFFAGVLKLNKEWLSGKAMLNTLMIQPVIPIEMLTGFVLLLELVLVWLLLSKKIKPYILLMLLFFHLYSWHQVGYFYPFVMFALLTIFIFGHRNDFDILKDFKSDKLGSLLIGVFVGFQIPGLILNGDEAITGEGRYLSLNMIDAYSQCHGYLFYEQDQQWTEISLKDGSGTFNTIRTYCEPLVYWRYAQSKCREFQNLGLKGDMHLSLFSKRTTDEKWTALIQEKNICASKKLARTITHHDFVRAIQSEDYAEGLGPLISLNTNSNDFPMNPKLVVHFLASEQRNNVIVGKVGKIANFKRIVGLNRGVHVAAKSSPVGDNTGFYVASDSGRLSKYDWDGNLLWNFFFQNALLGIHSTPLIVENSLFLGTYSGDFYRIDKNSGDLIWMRKVGDAVGASPLFFDGRIVVNSEFNTLNRWGGRLVALEPGRGSLLWKSEFFPDQSHSSPVFMNKQIYFGSNDGKVRVVDSATGKIIEVFPIHSEPIKSSLVGVNHFLYFSDWKGGLGKLSSQGHILWQKNQPGQNMSSPVLDEKLDQVYYGNSRGDLVKVDSANGKILKLWSTGSIGVKSGLLLVGRDLFFGCGEKDLCRLNIDNEKLEKIELDGRLTATPFFRDGKMVLVTDFPGSIWLFQFDKPYRK